MTANGSKKATRRDRRGRQSSDRTVRSGRGGASLAVDGRLTPGFYLTLAMTAVMPLAAARLKVGEGAGLTSNADIMWFGLLAFITLVAVVIDHLRQGRLTLPRLWLPAAMALFTMAAISSAIYAENLYLARLGAFRTALGAIYLLCVLMTADTAWKRRWLLAALVAGGIAVGLGVVISGQASQTHTLEHFRANRLEVLSQMRIVPDSPDEARFLARLQSDLPSTFYHPNLMSSYLKIAFLVGLGLVVGHIRRSWRERSWNFLIALLLVGMMAVMAWAMYLSRSRGALGALAVGAIVFAVMSLRPRRNWLRVAAVVMGLLAVAVLPLLIMTATSGPDAEATAFGRAMKTLAFRGDYWRASSRIIADHLWTGTGPENFGQFYPQYKLAHATEEVSDPHNAFVWSAAAMGIAGLAAMAALLAVSVGLMLRAARSSVAIAYENEANASRNSLPAPRQIALSLLVTLPVAAAMNSQGLYSGILAAIYWLIAFLMLIRLLDRGFLTLPGEAVVASGSADATSSDCDANCRGHLQNIMAAALVAAIIGWWINAMIDMNYRELPNLASLLLPAAVLALMLPGRSWQKAFPSDRWMVVLGPLLAVGLAYVVGLMVPVVRASAAVERASALEAAGQGGSAAHRLAVEQALRADPDWPQPHALLAGHHWFRAMAVTTPQERVDQLRSAAAALRRQIELDQRSIQALRLLAQVQLAHADTLDDMLPDERPESPPAEDDARIAALRRQRREAVDEALSALARAVELYPASADIRAGYAITLDERGRPADASREAGGALRLDDLMPEEWLRLDPPRRKRLEQLAAADGG